jgi:SAM-dependent methyltransferase
VPYDVTSRVQARVAELIRVLNDHIGDRAPCSPVVKDMVGRSVQQELLPYVWLTHTAERFYAKPRGYAGDAETIARIYANEPGGHGRLGPALDAAFLAQPAAQAVRNRRRLMVEIIRRTIAHWSGKTEATRVASLACGPAQELFDLYEQLEQPQCLHAQLVDVDERALEAVTARRDARGLEGFMTLHRANLLLLAARRRPLPVPAQHLVYSIGLIDYFDDARVVALIDWAYDMRAPDGVLVLGNFHPRNSDKALMDHVLEWRLVHRTEDDMHRLFSCSKFRRSADDIHFEAQGINLFAECRRG